MKGVAIIIIISNVGINVITVTIFGLIIVALISAIFIFRDKRIILLKDYSGADKYIKLSGEGVLSHTPTPVFKYKGEVISLNGLLIGVTNEINEWYLVDPKKTDLVNGEKCILKGRVTKKYYIAEKLGNNLGNNYYLISKLKVDIGDRNFECIGKVIFEFVNIKD